MKKADGTYSERLRLFDATSAYSTYTTQFRPDSRKSLLLPHQVSHWSQSRFDHCSKKGTGVVNPKSAFKDVHPYLAILYTTCNSPIMAIGHPAKSYHYLIVALMATLTMLLITSSAGEVATRDLQDVDYVPYPDDTEVWYEFEGGW